MLSNWGHAEAQIWGQASIARGSSFAAGFFCLTFAFRLLVLSGIRSFFMALYLHHSILVPVVLARHRLRIIIVVTPIAHRRRGYVDTYGR